MKEPTPPGFQRYLQAWKSADPSLDTLACEGEYSVSNCTVRRTANSVLLDRYDIGGAKAKANATVTLTQCSFRGTFCFV